MSILYGDIGEKFSVVFGTAAPVGGLYRRGALVINTETAPGLPYAWLCTATGEPGTWKAISGWESSGGASANAAVTASDKGTLVNQTVLTLDALQVAVTDALAYGGVKIFDFPEARILVLGCTASIQWAVLTDRTTTINANAALDWSLGTAIASNTTLSGTMVDLLPKIDTTLSAADAALNTAATGALAASAQFNGTSTAIDVYLNASFPTITEIDADGTLAATGTITLSWINLGDY